MGTVGFAEIKRENLRTVNTL